MREIIPLLPCRPAILSPTWILRFWATYTRTTMLAPGGSSSPCSLVNTRTSTTRPFSPLGTRSELSRTSRAFSPKIARNSFSSGGWSDSPLGVTLPTRISPDSTQAPIRIIPCSSSCRRASSPTLGISRVISSGPSFVCRASISYFSM